ncbi:MAG: Nramp family divalent metal transporter [Stellaceae bacterium]
MVFLDPPRAGLLLGRTRAFLRGSLDGRSSALAALRAFAGPTFIASVAYLDPGNFATNIAAGATHGYQLLWVVLLANLTAMLFQALSAKLGIVSGRSLARICREQLPAPLTRTLWAVSEIGAMATDLAELLGAAIGCALLLGTSLLVGTVLAGMLSWVILGLHQRSFRTVEAIIAGLILVVGLCFLVETALIPPDWRAVIKHSFVPSFGGAGGVMLAAGIVGATVMPHALFLHSSVARDRLPAGDPSVLRRLVRASNIDIGLTLSLVGLVNMAMMYLAAVTFSAAGPAHPASIESAYHLLGPLFGDAAAAIFIVSLLASGLSSSVVGTMAGQVIMQDFLDWQIPLWVRRLATMLPTVVIAAFVTDATKALVISQVVLSFVLPVPLITLVLFTGSRSVMGKLANSPALGALAIAATAIVLGLNALLLASLLAPG